MVEHQAWPALPYERWAPTKKTLHMCTQMLGKTRLALAPPLPEWMHSSLQLDARGFTTGPMPSGTRIVVVSIDIFDAVIRVEVSDGRVETVSLVESQTVADIWAGYRRALDSLGVDADIWEKPQETSDETHFSDNHTDGEFVPADAQRFHRALGSIQAVFEKFRSQFFGRSGVQFWWGSFDLAVLLFNGEKVAAPDDRGYIMRYDLDAKHINAGFWIGDDSTPSASFYAYIVPQPPGCDTAPIGPSHANWVETMGEWMMSYEDVRTSEDPEKLLLEFLNSVYRFATSDVGWSADQLSYITPAPSVHK